MSGFTTPDVDWFGNASGAEIPISGSFGNTDTGSDFFGNSGTGGTDWNKVLKAVGTLSDANAGQKGVQNLPGSVPAAAQARPGTPAHAESLTALLQMLNQRRDLYLNAAMNPGAGPVQQGPPGPGLLGV